MQKSRERIVKEFEKLGFDVMKKDKLMSELSVFGIIPAEPYNVGKNHFAPTYRSVFFGTAKGGYYITSGIHGKMRLYHCRSTEDTEIGNIFGHGKTIKEALKNFAYNFTNKIYNKR